MLRSIRSLPLPLVCGLLFCSAPLHAQLSQAGSHQQVAKELFLLVGGSSLAQSAAEGMELGAKHGERHNQELQQLLAEVDKGEAGN